MPNQHLLKNTSLAECLSIYRSTEKKPALATKVVQLSSVIELEKKTANLLERVVSVANPIPRLKENPAIESWVKTGRILHDGKDACQFCEQQLPYDLLDRLAGHFSADYDNLMEEIVTLAESIQVAKKESITLDHRGDFYPELANRFTTEKSKLDTLFEARNTALASLATALESKKTKAFAILNSPNIDDPTEQITNAIDAINQISAEHNARTAEFDKKRVDALSKLEKHYAALFVCAEKYNEKLQAITNLNNKITEQTAQLNDLDAQIRTLEQTLSESAKGAERINELLAAYFGKDDLRIIVTTKKRFQIVRGSSIAKNLSEGEKTAIAFAYFIARVQNGQHPLADTRIVVDDPISSLDANHLFNTYALIRTQLADCRQLFISTHSFEFYNLICEWVKDDENTKKPQTDWKKWSIFLVKRVELRKSILEEIPKELLKFKSEYHYLFSKLYNYNKIAKSDFDSLLSLPNIVRRFMEAFGGVMIPRHMGLRGKMELIFPDPVVRERVWKFINNYSHQTTLTRSLTIPDLSECKAIVQACLKAIQDWDAEYFKCLEDEIS